MQNSRFVAGLENDAGMWSPLLVCYGCCLTTEHSEILPKTEQNLLRVHDGAFAYYIPETKTLGLLVYGRDLKATTFPECPGT